MNILKSKWLGWFTKERLIFSGIVIVLLLTNFVKCESKLEKSLKADLEQCKADLLACDTATFDVSIIETKKETEPETVEIPAPLIVEDGPTIKDLKNQVRRNKLKQVTLIGDCKKDSIAFADAIYLRDSEIHILSKLIEESDSLIVALKDDLKQRLYQDSIKKERYTAAYKITTEGKLKGFELDVEPKMTIVTRTIKQKPTKDEIEKAAELLKKNNFFAVKGGAIYVSGSDKFYWTPSLEFGHKWFLIEGGLILDENFSSKSWYKGMEAKAGAMIRF